MTKYNLYPHEFWLKVDQKMTVCPTLRYGQAVYNILYVYKPDHARYITGSDLDPYNNDDVVPALSEWLARHWLDEFE